MEVQTPRSKSHFFWGGIGRRKVTYIVECVIGRAKTAEPMELAFEMVSLVDQRNCVLNWRAYWRHLANTVERLCDASVNGWRRSLFPNYSEQSCLRFVQFNFIILRVHRIGYVKVIQLEHFSGAVAIKQTKISLDEYAWLSTVFCTGFIQFFASFIFTRAISDIHLHVLFNFLHANPLLIALNGAYSSGL